MAFAGIPLVLSWLSFYVLSFRFLPLPFAVLFAFESSLRAMNCFHQNIQESGNFTQNAIDGGKIKALFDFQNTTSHV